MVRFILKPLCPLIKWTPLSPVRCPPCTLSLGDLPMREVMRLGAWHWGHASWGFNRCKYHLGSNEMFWVPQCPGLLLVFLLFCDCVATILHRRCVHVFSLTTSALTLVSSGNVTRQLVKPLIIVSTFAKSFQFSFFGPCHTETCIVSLFCQHLFSFSLFIREGFRT